MPGAIYYLHTHTHTHTHTHRHCSKPSHSTPHTYLQRGRCSYKELHTSQGETREDCLLLNLLALPTRLILHQSHLGPAVLLRHLSILSLRTLLCSREIQDERMTSSLYVTSSQHHFLDNLERSILIKSITFFGSQTREETIAWHLDKHLE